MLPNRLNCLQFFLLFCVSSKLCCKQQKLANVVADAVCLCVCVCGCVCVSLVMKNIESCLPFLISILLLCYVKHSCVESRQNKVGRRKKLWRNKNQKNGTFAFHFFFCIRLFFVKIRPTKLKF